MTDPVAFLTSLGQGFSALALYAEGHPARERAIHSGYDQLEQLLQETPEVRFSFIGGDVVYGGRILRQLKGWEWATRFAVIGLEQVEFTASVTREEYRGWVNRIWGLIRGEGSAPETPPPAGGIRWGRITMAGESLEELATGSVTALLSYPLEEEVGCVVALQDEVARRGQVPVGMADAVVRSLALTMRREGQVILPLLDLLRHDQYATAHAANVAVLVMGLAEYLGHAPREARLLGVAGLLHDIGMLRVPTDLLQKPGPLTAEERAVMEGHTTEGARLLLEGHHGVELAAVVAAEHHLAPDGSGYPALAFPREPHPASRMVRVADMYDALCSRRPWRDAHDPETALRMVEAEAGRSLDVAVVMAFGTMIRQARVARLSPEQPVVEVAAAAPAGG